MKLRFYAREGLAVRVPFVIPTVGQPDLYVGRTFEANNGYPATESAYECEADSDTGRRLLKLVRREHSLWPADEATANACGVEFTATEFKDGAHVAKAAPPAPKATKAEPKGAE